MSFSAWVAFCVNITSYSSPLALKKCKIFSLALSTRVVLAMDDGLKEWGLPITEFASRL